MFVKGHKAQCGHRWLLAHCLLHGGICDRNQLYALQWRHNDHGGSPASRLFTKSFIQAKIKEHIKAPLHWPLCGEFTGTGEFPAQRASYAENVSIWWRHHGISSIQGWQCKVNPNIKLYNYVWKIFSLRNWEIQKKIEKYNESHSLSYRGTQHFIEHVKIYQQYKRLWWISKTENIPHTCLTYYKHMRMSRALAKRNFWYSFAQRVLTRMQSLLDGQL